jgi:hypothetical protein
MSFSVISVNAVNQNKGNYKKFTQIITTIMVKEQHNDKH